MNTPPVILAFGLGPQEIFLIFLAILLLFGAKKLPEFARGLGRSMGEFRKARQEFEHEITKSVDEKDTKI
jgi:sec-independent protein translocase protein TatA